MQQNGQLIHLRQHLESTVADQPDATVVEDTTALPSRHRSKIILEDGTVVSLITPVSEFHLSAVQPVHYRLPQDARTAFPDRDLPGGVYSLSRQDLSTTM